MFAIDDRRVLRSYRHDLDTAAEAAVMRHVAAHGFPAPTVYRAEGPDLEMERLHGLPSPGGSGGVPHMNLHPDNVVLTEQGPVVIDWPNTREGDPDLDRALTALLLAMVSLTAADPLAGLAEECLPHYVADTRNDPVRLLEEVVAPRRRDPNLSTAEISALPRALTLVRSLR